MYLEIFSTSSLICLDLIVPYKSRENLSARMEIKERLSLKVVIPIKVVLVHTKEEVILTLEVVFMVNVIDVGKKVIDPLNASLYVNVVVKIW